MTVDVEPRRAAGSSRLGMAAVFGVTDPETAIRWLILMMVLCCDPLAIAPHGRCG